MTSIEGTAVEGKDVSGRMGSCFCGAVRFTASSAPKGLTHCHCITCRKLSGAPFMTWTNFPISAMTWHFNTPSPSADRATAASTVDIKSDAASPFKTVKVSDIAERGFCQECGSPLTMWYFCEPD